MASPVGYSYADGQYWDDTLFDIPPYATGAKVTLYYQATTKEYIEFLRDNNPDAGVDPFNRGELAYALWEHFGKSPPVAMATLGTGTLIDVELKGDTDGNRRVDADDVQLFVNALTGSETDPRIICASDMDGLNGPQFDDVVLFVDALLSP